MDPLTYSANSTQHERQTAVDLQFWWGEKACWQLVILMYMLLLEVCNAGYDP